MGRPRLDKNACSVDFFTDIPLSKLALAPMLGVSRPTLQSWENVLFWRLKHFRESYPQLPNGTRYREAKLNGYQCWCLCRAGRLMLVYDNIELLKMEIANNPQYFSIYSYKNAVKQLQLATKGA